MKQIKLTRGYSVTIDDDDYEWAKQHCWYSNLSARGIPYARNLGLGSLHRALALRWGWEIDGKTIDHINHDTLDCRRENLRVLTKSENGRNQKSRKTSNHPNFVGVTYRKHVGRWDARIRHKGRQIFLGYFDSVEDAAFAYDYGVLYYFGEDGVLNFPDRIGEHDLSKEPKTNLRKTPKTNKTGYRGVHVKSGKYGASISFGGRNRQTKVFLGSFDNPADAAMAYDIAFLYINGADTRLMNFPDVNYPSALVSHVQEILTRRGVI